MFIAGQEYTRTSVRELLGLPESKGGAWATGHVRHGGEHFIFCGVDTPGRTGHNYLNRFEGTQLIWHPRLDTSLAAPVFAELISGAAPVHVFHRSDDRRPFTYAGAGRVGSIESGPPIEVRWTFDEVPSNSIRAMPAYYVLGTKYGTPARDMLPAMLNGSVAGMGFAKDVPLDKLIGLQPYEIASELLRLLPTESDHCRRQLALFLQLRPGDVIALKASGSPVGAEPRLVLARYAVVAGNEDICYEHAQPLGHTIAVNLLDEMEPIVLSLGYGRTLHRIDSDERIAEIFGAYAKAAPARQGEDIDGVALKAVHTTRVAPRSEYLMKRVHNQLQNSLYELLHARYGTAARLEMDNVDISVRLPGRLLLVEVKSSPSPTYCIREALGQMLHYAWRGNHEFSRVSFLVVGPSIPTSEDARFLACVREATLLTLHYCTPETYNQIKPFE